MLAKSTRRVVLWLCIILQCSLVLSFAQAPNSANSSSALPAGNSTKPPTASSNATATNSTKSAASASRSAAIAKKLGEKALNHKVAWGFLYGWLCLAAVFAIFLSVIVVRRYIRTTSSLNPGNTQAYFRPVNRHWGLFKKHFVFAPLFHKRHHRPFMLTRTIDNGCLPSRPQTFLLVTYFIILVIASFYGIDYNQKRGDMLSAISKRSGLLALCHMVPLFLLAARNNPLISWTGITFDTYNLFHRWLGRFIVLNLITHITTYLVKKVSTLGWGSFKHDLKTWLFIRAGTITAFSVFLIFLTSWSPIRHRFYETFLHVHQILAAIVVWGVWTHMDGYAKQRRVIVAIIVIWVFERTCRLVRIIYRNIGRPVTSAEIEIMSPIAMRVKIRLARPWTFTPGQHAYMYMPFVGLWTAHPFSVAWTDEDVEETISEKDSLPKSTEEIVLRHRNIYFLIRRMKGFTNNLYLKAQKAGGKLKTTALLEGPYNQQTLHSYGTVILIAAGIGITHIVPHVHDLVRGYGNGTVAARRVLLVWSVRDLDELELIRDWMTIILSLPRRYEVLRIKLYVFQLDESKLDYQSTTIEIFPGIAKFGPIMDEEVANSIGSIGVSVCGIGVVADEVRFACRKWMDKVNIEFMEESFSW